MKDDIFDLVFLVIVLAFIVALVCVGLTHAAEPPRVGVWLDGECVYDRPELLLKPGVETCMEMVHLEPDKDHQLLSVAPTPEQHPTVPEPMTALLLATGIAGLLIGRRRNER